MNKPILSIIFAGVAVMSLIVTQPALAHGSEKHQPAQNSMFTGMDSEAAKVAKAFHHALRNGDEKSARELLANDVLIFEGKGVERSADEYASHHMKSDIKFLNKMSITPLEHHVQSQGLLATSISRAKISGHYKDKDIDIVSAETMLLKKVNGKWKITHLHW
jgi:ketosteroid isomerase-like protein